MLNFVLFGWKILLLSKGTRELSPWVNETPFADGRQAIDSTKWVFDSKLKQVLHGRFHLSPRFAISAEARAQICRRGAQDQRRKAKPCRKHKHVFGVNSCFEVPHLVVAKTKLQRMQSGFILRFPIPAKDLVLHTRRKLCYEGLTTTTFCNFKCFFWIHVQQALNLRTVPVVMDATGPLKVQADAELCPIWLENLVAVQRHTWIVTVSQWDSVRWR